LFRSLLGIERSTADADVEHMRRRVGFFARVMLAIDVLAWLSDVVGPLVVADLDPPEYSPESLAIRVTSTLVVLSVALLTHFRRLSSPVLVALEVGLTLWLSIVYVGVALGVLVEPGVREFSAPFAMFGMILLLGARAALVPSPVSRTILVGILAMGVVYFGMAERIDELAPEIQDGLRFMAGAYVLASASTSHVIYGLRREVREAMQLGQYTLEGKLGQGGMGAVYRARHAMLRRRAAIKLIRADAGSTTDAMRARFEREADATASLESPHTVKLFDFGVSNDGDFYTVMELLVGIDLESAITRFGPMPPERVVFLLRQACASLGEAHAAGLVHRDVKPANLMICRYGGPVDVLKVLDFGLVALERGIVGGTPATMAPEVINGAEDVDGRADLYALGCVAYWLLTGERVFTRDTVDATLRAHLEDDPVPPSARVETPIPATLEAVVMSCLAKDPARRPADADMLDSMLAEAVDASTWTQDRALSWWDRHRPEDEAGAAKDDGDALHLTVRMR